MEKRIKRVVQIELQQTVTRRYVATVDCYATLDSLRRMCFETFAPSAKTTTAAFTRFALNDSSIA